MTIDSDKEIAEFSSFRRTYDPEVFRIAREMERDSGLLSERTWFLHSIS
ncbi:MAG: hypothetical protein IJL02_00460 [Methanobrevibacter sp.]|nr:hypothetical protein [Methanobrevibacter sp.]MBQ6098318.1 hypothetical protein [Methanobrevibacter sp.]